MIQLIEPSFLFDWFRDFEFCGSKSLVLHLISPHASPQKVLEHHRANMHVVTILTVWKVGLVDIGQMGGCWHFAALDATCRRYRFGSAHRDVTIITERWAVRRWPFVELVSPCGATTVQCPFGFRCITLHPGFVSIASQQCESRLYQRRSWTAHSCKHQDRLL